MDQPGKVANPARGQLNRENDIPLSPCVPENSVSRYGFSRPVPRQPAHLHTQAESGCMYCHTYSKSMDQPGRVANPARGQLNRETEYSMSCPRSPVCGQDRKRSERRQKKLERSGTDRPCSEGLGAFRFFFKIQTEKHPPV